MSTLKEYRFHIFPKNCINPKGNDQSNEHTNTRHTYTEHWVATHTHALQAVLGLDDLLKGIQPCRHPYPHIFPAGQENQSMSQTYFFNLQATAAL